MSLKKFTYAKIKQAMELYKDFILLYIIGVWILAISGTNDYLIEIQGIELEAFALWTIVLNMVFGLYYLVKFIAFFITKNKDITIESWLTIVYVTTTIVCYVSKKDLVIEKFFTMVLSMYVTMYVIMYILLWYKKRRK